MSRQARTTAVRFLAGLLTVAAGLLLAPLPAATAGESEEAETLLLSDIVAQAQAQAQAAPAMPADPLARREWVRQIVRDAALRYGVPANLVWAIALCESGGNPFAFNTWSRAAGLFQVVPGTWGWASRQAGYASASPFDPVANAEVAVWLMASPQYGGLRHWAACLR